MEENEFDLGFANLEEIFGPSPSSTEEPQNTEKEEEKEKEKEITDEGQSVSQESVGNEDINKEESKESPEPTGDGTPNIASSITSALVDEGLLTTLSEERVKNIKSAEELVEAFKEDQYNQLNERQKRIEEALNYNMDPSRVQQYEQYLQTLNSITDDILESEDSTNENYRKNIIYQNYLEKGFDKDDALELTNRSFESGKDIEDAKKALNSLKKIYQQAYDNERANAKKSYDDLIKAQEKQLEDLKTSIMGDSEFFDQFSVNKGTRQKIYDTVTKTMVGKDGKQRTALQSYFKDNPVEAYRTVGTLYVLTNGFTDFSSLSQKKAKKEVKKSLEQLDSLLKNTQRIDDGSLRFQAGVSEDTSGGIDEDWIEKLNIE